MDERARKILKRVLFTFGGIMLALILGAACFLMYIGHVQGRVSQYRYVAKYVREGSFDYYAEHGSLPGSINQLRREDFISSNTPYLDYSVVQFTKKSSDTVELRYVGEAYGFWSKEKIKNVIDEDLNVENGRLQSRLPTTAE